MASEVGEQLGTTAENARQQLAKLAADGVVEATPESRGIGRPAQIRQLTTVGHGRFPDAHADLTVDLIRTIRSTLGEQALATLIAAGSGEPKMYADALVGAPTAEERIARLAQVRDREGYIAEWRRADDGQGWLLIENHCPICAAATVCQGFCDTELDIFREVLGPELAVRRVEHILLGMHRCAYRIEASAG